MVIADDAIVDQANAVFVIEVRVRINICLISMGCPPCVPDSDVVVVQVSTHYRDSFDAVAAKPVGAGEFCLDEHWLSSFRVICNRYNTAAVVAAGFQNLEALDADRTRFFLRSEVPDNSTALVWSLIEVFVGKGSHEAGTQHELPHISFLRK